MQETVLPETTPIGGPKEAATTPTGPQKAVMKVSPNAPVDKFINLVDLFSSMGPTAVGDIISAIMAAPEIPSIQQNGFFDVNVARRIWVDYLSTIQGGGSSVGIHNYLHSGIPSNATYFTERELYNVVFRAFMPKLDLDDY